MMRIGLEIRRCCHMESGGGRGSLCRSPERKKEVRTMAASAYINAVVWDTIGTCMCVSLITYSNQWFLYSA